MGSEELYPGEHKIIDPETDEVVYVMTSREWAGEIFRELAKYVEVGLWPPSLSVFDVGRALGRAFANTFEAHPYIELAKGIGRCRKMQEEGLSGSTKEVRREEDKRGVGEVQSQGHGGDNPTEPVGG